MPYETLCIVAILFQRNKDQDRGGHFIFLFHHNVAILFQRNKDQDKSIFFIHTNFLVAILFQRNKDQDS